jgi:hypothetical protein
MRQGVLPADLRAAIQPVFSLCRQRRVLTFEHIRVLDQRKVERLAEAVRHLAGRSVDD